MNLPRSGAHVIVRSRDPRLRSLIAERLADVEDLTIEMDTAGGAPTPGVDGVPAQKAAVTPREIEVLGLMAEGLANKEIAARLAFSTHTAKFHVESLLRKLDAANRAEAVREGIRRGLIGV